MMKNFTSQWLNGVTVKMLSLVILVLASMAVNANEIKKGESARTDNEFTLTVFDNNKVLINCNLQASNTSEYFEIERSVDNKTFTTVGVLFATTAEEQPMRNGLALKDKPAQKTTGTVYYRIKTVSGNQVSYSQVKTVTLQ
jgi:hypothetical protein